MSKFEMKFGLEHSMQSTNILISLIGGFGVLICFYLITLFLTARQNAWDLSFKIFAVSAAFAVWFQCIFIDHALKRLSDFYRRGDLTVIGLITSYNRTSYSNESFDLLKIFDVKARLTLFLIALWLFYSTVVFGVILIFRAITGY